MGFFLATVRDPSQGQGADRQNYKTMNVFQALMMTSLCRSFYAGRPQSFAAIGLDL